MYHCAHKTIINISILLRDNKYLCVCVSFWCGPLKIVRPPCHQFAKEGSDVASHLSSNETIAFPLFGKHFTKIEAFNVVHNDGWQHGSSSSIRLVCFCGPRYKWRIVHPSARQCGTLLIVGSIETYGIECFHLKGWHGTSKSIGSSYCCCWIWNKWETCISPTLKIR